MSFCLFRLIWIEDVELFLYAILYFCSLLRCTWLNFHQNLGKTVEQGIRNSFTSYSKLDSYNLTISDNRFQHNNHMAQGAFAFRNKAYEISLETLSPLNSEEASKQVEDTVEVGRVEPAEKSNTRNGVIVAFVLILVAIITMLAVVFSVKRNSEAKAGQTFGSK